MSDQIALFEPNTYHPKVVAEKLYKALETNRKIPLWETNTLIELWDQKVEDGAQPLNSSVVTKLKLYGSLHNKNAVESYENHWPNIFRLLDGLLDGIYDFTEMVVNPAQAIASLEVIGEEVPDFLIKVSDETRSWILAQLEYHHINFIPIRNSGAQHLKYINAWLFDPSISKNWKTNKMNYAEYLTRVPQFGKEVVMSDIDLVTTQMPDLLKWQEAMLLEVILTIFMQKHYLYIHPKSPLLTMDEYNRTEA
jgi:hypothetical protein